MSVEIFGRIGPSIIIFSVMRVGLELTTKLKIALRNHLLSSFNERRNVVVAIGTCPNKITTRNNIIDRIRNGLLSCLSLRFYIIWPIAWVSVENTSIDLQFPLWSKHLLLLQRVYDIITCICRRIIKFTLGKDFVLGMDSFLRTSLESFIVVV